MTPEYQLPLSLQLASKEAVLNSLATQVVQLTEEFDSLIQTIETVTSEIKQIQDRIDQQPPDQETAVSDPYFEIPTPPKLQPESPEDQE